MSTETTVSPDVLQRLQERLERVAKGIRDPDEMREGAKNMDRMREELRQRIGIVNVAVELIRDARNQ
ncbi:MAG TPA: hypothetical protein VFI31_08930 [Pirellulales bacterium]|nr:hypothetical protein [Pirellulales bacterium]